MEHIRTERTDTPAGKAMAEKLEHAQAGNTLLCWKVMEDITLRAERRAAGAGAVSH